MAETQDNYQYKTIKRKEISDDEDGVDDINVLNKQQKNIEIKENYNNYQSIASFGDEPVDDLLALANDDATAVETANLLLSEHQPNFVDFDEFNICLNNILNDDVDSQLELSPSVVISDTLTTVEVDELFKVNTEVKNKSLNHMPTTSTLNDKTISSTNSSSSSNSSSNSSISKTSFHNEQISQSNHNKHHNDTLEDDDRTLLNMVQFDDHMDFSFTSGLESTSNTSSHITTTTTTHIATSINNSKYNENIFNTRHCSNHRNRNYSINKTNVHNIDIGDDDDDDDDDLDLNMTVDPINIQSICNPTATVSASLTTSAAPSNINIHDNDDDEDEDNVAPQETALNNVIKRNSHSIVNIFQ